MNSVAEAEWVKPSEYAAHFRISPGTVARLIATGKIPVRRIGDRIVRIHRSELDNPVSA